MLERNNRNTWVQLYSGVKRPDSITPSYQISQFCGQKSAKFYQADCHFEYYDFVKCFLGAED
jgi:hypothetical protein